MQLSLPRDARYVHVMRSVAERVLDELNAPDQAVDDVRVALSEACANVVRHAAGSSEYTVRFAAAADGCEVEILDLGPGFDPEGRPAAVPDDETGRGLALMRALVDDLEFLRSEDSTRVRLVKRWPGLGLTPRPAGERPTGG